jgi:hypothetical protein
MQDKLIIAVIVLLIGMGIGIYFTRNHYKADIIQLNADLKAIKDAGNKLKADNEKYLAELAAKPIAPPAPEVIERIKKIYVDKPVYVYVDNECKLTDNFIEAYNEYLRLAK